MPVGYASCTCLKKVRIFMESRDKIYYDILQELQHLSFSALKDVKLFIIFLKIREKTTNQGLHVDINKDLKCMDIHESNHLEQEFSNYQDLYPRSTPV